MAAAQIMIAVLLGQAGVFVVQACLEPGPWGLSRHPSPYPLLHPYHLLPAAHSSALESQVEIAAGVTAVEFHPYLNFEAFVAAGAEAAVDFVAELVAELPSPLELRLPPCCSGSSSLLLSEQ